MSRFTLLQCEYGLPNSFVRFDGGLALCQSALQIPDGGSAGESRGRLVAMAMPLDYDPDERLVGLTGALTWRSLSACA